MCSPYSVPNERSKYTPPSYSEERYKSIKELCKLYRNEIPDNQIKAYANVFDYIDHITDNVFNDEDIYLIYQYYTHLIQGKYPGLLIYCRNDDIIPTIARFMEEDPLVKGKLTMEQKLRIGFCIRALTGIKNQPEGAPFDWFETIETMEDHFNSFREDMPFWFDVKEAPIENIEKYGLSVSEPIRTTSIHASKIYLKRLRYNKKPILYKRITTHRGKFGHIIDEYKIFIEKKFGFKNHYFKIDKSICNLYIDPYSFSEPQIAPKDFMLYEFKSARK